MSRAQSKGRARLPKTAEIIHLPHHDFSFEAVEIDLVDKYRARVNDVDMLQSVLKLTSAEMKARLALLAEADRHEIGATISNFENRAENYARLSEFFKCAACRLTVVNAKLV
jgi:hypothetical protein